MARYRTTVSSPWDGTAAFDYMANFANTAAWDPGVRRAHQITPGDVGLGTRFEVVADFNGRSLPLIYEITVFEPPRRVVLRAETPLVVSRDDITFTPTDRGTDVTYDAELRTRGWLTLAAPVVARMFRGVGKRARVGLQRELTAR